MCKAIEVLHCKTVKGFIPSTFYCRGLSELCDFCNTSHIHQLYSTLNVIQIHHLHLYISAHVRQANGAVPTMFARQLAKL